MTAGVKAFNKPSGTRAKTHMLAADEGCESWRVFFLITFFVSSHGEQIGGVSGSVTHSALNSSTSFNAGGVPAGVVQ
jgi:hypothetical protein